MHEITFIQYYCILLELSSLSDMKKAQLITFLVF